MDASSSTSALRSPLFDRPEARAALCTDRFQSTQKKEVVTTNLDIHRTFASAHNCIGGLMPPGPWRLLFGLLALAGICEAGQTSASDSPPVAATNVAAANARTEKSRMWMTIDQRRFAITLADNEAARAFAALLPLTLEMAELNGNEKHGELPHALPTKEAVRPGTIRNGDLMLYGSKTLVVFYLTFDSSYSYTPLGRVDDPAGLAEALGLGKARVEFLRTGVDSKSRT